MIDLVLKFLGWDKGLFFLLQILLLVQIRVHLQYTGHPIANDLLYLSEPVSERATQGMSADRSAACSGHSLTSNTHENYLDRDENSVEEFSSHYFNTVFKKGDMIR